MKVEKKAVMICFSVRSGEMDSNYERNKFFRGLYGWKQTINKGGKRYEYRREGVLDEMPYEKVDQSSFIVPENSFEELVKFMDEWHDKVMWRTFKILLEDKDIFADWEEEEDA
ncbi:MAG: hypothetical protein V1944_01545 [Candidatus Aenigmatarchaeota archaeon]